MKPFVLVAIVFACAAACTAEELRFDRDGQLATSDAGPSCPDALCEADAFADVLLPPPEAGLVDRAAPDGFAPDAFPFDAFPFDAGGADASFFDAPDAPIPFDGALD